MIVTVSSALIFTQTLGSKMPAAATVVAAPIEVREVAADDQAAAGGGADFQERPSDRGCRGCHDFSLLTLQVMRGVSRFDFG